ncbi:hypothetical protein MNBD_BACTEROID05-612 [hydrothermal vent metagenome]|uniref:Serine aminopeptidase S33 domain-containing protein n=1 Tax=hydrothermal vent metagenome TaxID=652676 RepID=A0A3B0TU56_9ZZZZ
MKMIVLIIIFCVSVIVYVRFLERTTLFVPDKIITTTPRDVGIEFEDVFFVTKDQVKVHGWFVKGKSSSSKVLLFFHGNAGNISGRVEKVQIFYDLGLSVFIIDYRGYGKSDGSPTEKGMYLDAQGAYDYLVDERNIAGEDIIVYGASLGGVAAIDLANQRKISSLIVDGTFSSARDMAKQIFPFIPSFLINIKLDSIEKIKNIEVPKLMIHSMDDQTVPFSLGKKLFDAASEPKIFLSLSGDHNEVHNVDRVKFVEGIESFLKQ